VHPSRHAEPGDITVELRDLHIDAIVAVFSRSEMVESVSCYHHSRGLSVVEPQHLLRSGSQVDSHWNQRYRVRPSLSLRVLVRRANGDCDDGLCVLAFGPGTCDRTGCAANRVSNRNAPRLEDCWACVRILSALAWPEVDFVVSKRGLAGVLKYPGRPLSTDGRLGVVSDSLAVSLTVGVTFTDLDALLLWSASNWLLVSVSRAGLCQWLLLPCGSCGLGFVDLLGCVEPVPN
jgi:hypothetical protein